MAAVDERLGREILWSFSPWFGRKHSPITTFKIFAGIPTWRASLAAAEAMRGVGSESFTTTMQLQAKVGSMGLEQLSQRQDSCFYCMGWSFVTGGLFRVVWKCLSSWEVPRRSKGKKTSTDRNEEKGRKILISTSEPPFCYRYPSFSISSLLLLQGIFAWSLHDVHSLHGFDSSHGVVRRWGASVHHQCSWDFRHHLGVLAFFPLSSRLWFVPSSRIGCSLLLRD